MSRLLRITIDTYEIIEVRKSFRTLGTRTGVVTASRIGALQAAVELMVRRFNYRQQTQSNIADGRLESLHDLVFGPWATHGFPFGAAILHGMHHQEALRMPHDINSYVVRIDDGPPAQREFGDLTMIATYQDAENVLVILWLGPEAEAPGVVLRLRATTNEFADWGPLLTNGRRGWST